MSWSSQETTWAGNLRSKLADWDAGGGASAASSVVDTESPITPPDRGGEVRRASARSAVDPDKAASAPSELRSLA